MKEMKPCPFCGCVVGTLEIGGGWRWYGDHKSFCILEGNPSSWYGRREDMIADWNRRDYEQKPKHRQATIRGKARGRKGTTRD